MSNPEQGSSRKSLIATSVAALVLWVDKSPGINWVVDIDGAWTWGFLLGAHSYFSIMYVASHGLQDFKIESICLVKWDRSQWGAPSFRLRLAMWMRRPFVTMLAIGAFVVICYNLATVWSATATKAIAGPF